MTDFDTASALVIDRLLSLTTNTATYTEPGGSGQAASCLERGFTVQGDGITARQIFTFKTSDLTLDAALWRGAIIVGSDGEDWKVRDRINSPGAVQFIAERPLRRT